MAAGSRGRRGAGPWTPQTSSGIAAVNRFQELAMDDDDVEDEEEEEEEDDDDEDERKVPGHAGADSSKELEQLSTSGSAQQGTAEGPVLAEAPARTIHAESPSSGPPAQQQQGKQRDGRSERQGGLTNAWHEDEHSSDGDGNGREGEFVPAPSHPTPATASAAVTAQRPPAAATVEDDIPLAYDSASSAASSSDNLTSLPPELRAHTASLLAQAQAAEGLSPTAELIFDTAIWTIPLVFVFVLLDVLVRQQYSQPIWWSGEAKRVLSRGPFIGAVSYYSLKHRSSSWLRSGFFGLSLGAGAGFLYVTAKSDYEAVLRQTPALGALWVMSIVKLDLIPAVVSLALVGAFVKVLDLDLFQ
ncbi:hypothetical protein OC861_003527 [Tilletia horrida]|nr:hypothetical protein OC861_003527 [Tilletia horrida]